MDVNVVAQAGGEVLELGPIQTRLLEDGGTTDHRLAVARFTVPPHTPGPPSHWHRLHDEGFYILTGTLRFTVGSARQDAAAGTMVMVPPRTPHTFANLGDQPASFLNTFTPDFYIDYFRDLARSIAEGTPITPELNLETMARYATFPGVPQGVEPAPDARS